MAKKRDTGIALLKTGIPIREELRDALAKRDWSKPQRDLDMRSIGQTTKDMEIARFSGFRVNEFTGDVELWLLGKIAARERCYDVVKSPSLLATMHEKAFLTVGSIVAVDPIKLPASKVKH